MHAGSAFAGLDVHKDTMAVAHPDREEPICRDPVQKSARHDVG